MNEPFLKARQRTQEAREENDADGYLESLEHYVYCAGVNASDAKWYAGLAAVASIGTLVTAIITMIVVIAIR